MPSPLIGITCGTSALDRKAAQHQDRLNRSYSRAIQAAGGVPLLLPNLADPVQAETLTARLDGLLLSGGCDVSPARYGEQPLNSTVEVDTERDETEMLLIGAALPRRLPLLAICRGIQALNVALGGTLWQDLPAQHPSPLHHRQEAPRHAATHTIEIAGDSRLARIAGGTQLAVNTFHHQAIRTVGGGLQVTATAEDGVVEAVEGRSGDFVLGVQYHPEEMIEVCDGAARLFRAFVEAAGTRTAFRV